MYNNIINACQCFGKTKNIMEKDVFFEKIKNTYDLTKNLKENDDEIIEKIKMDRINYVKQIFLPIPTQIYDDFINKITTENLTDMEIFLTSNTRNQLINTFKNNIVQHNLRCIMDTNISNFKLIQNFGINIPIDILKIDVPSWYKYTITENDVNTFIDTVKTYQITQIKNYNISSNYFNYSYLLYSHIETICKDNILNNLPLDLYYCPSNEKQIVIDTNNPLSKLLDVSIDTNNNTFSLRINITFLKII